jgi:hypothetical protein
MDLRLIDFDSPSEVREFEKSFRGLRSWADTRATHEPGWKWSQHVGPARGERLYQVGRGWIPIGLSARPLPTTIVAAAP